MITTGIAATITLTFGRSSTVTGVSDGELRPRDGLNSRATGETWEGQAEFKRHQCSVAHSADDLRVVLRLLAFDLLLLLLLPMGWR